MHRTLIAQAYVVGNNENGPRTEIGTRQITLAYITFIEAKIDRGVKAYNRDRDLDELTFSDWFDFIAEKEVDDKSTVLGHEDYMLFPFTLRQRTFEHIIKTEVHRFHVVARWGHFYWSARGKHDNNLYETCEFSFNVLATWRRRLEHDAQWAATKT